jgi:hypothetical protein
MFLGQTLVAVILMSNPQSFESSERILNYVLSKQLEYVHFKKDHPFLEQTVMNLAMYYRQANSHITSYRMFDFLYNI